MEYCWALASVNVAPSKRRNGGVLNCALQSRTNSSHMASVLFMPAPIGQNLPAVHRMPKTSLYTFLQRLDSPSILNTCKFPLSNNGFTRTSHAEGETLDHHGYESFPGHDLADIDEIQLGQTNLVDTRHVPLGR